MKSKEWWVCWHAWDSGAKCYNWVTASKTQISDLPEFLAPDDFLTLTPLQQLQHFCCKFPKIRFFTYLPRIEFFRIWHKLLKFDLLHENGYFIFIFWSDKTWVDDFDRPVLARQISYIRKNELNNQITDKSVIWEASEEIEWQITTLSNLWYNRKERKSQLRILMNK